MWYFEHITTFIWIFCLIGDGRAHGISCHNNGINRVWQPKGDEDYRPGQLYENIFPQLPKTIIVQVHERKENVTLTVLVKPHVLDESQCPSDPNTEYDLRRFHKHHFVDVKGDPNTSIYYDDAPTGCYYFILTNEEQKNWLWGPSYHETNVTFYDTMLKCNISDLDPDNEISSKQLEITFKVPTRCLRLEIRLFEFDVKTKDENETLKLCDSGQIPATQICSISLIDCNGSQGNATLTCHRPSTITAVEVALADSPYCEKDRSWTIRILWTGLKLGDAWYYSRFKQYNQCNLTLRELGTWQPDTILGVIYHGDSVSSNIETSPKHAQIDLNILYAVLAAIVLSIFAYWIWKCTRNGVPKIPESKKTYWKESNILINPREEPWLNNEGESKQILLMYARGSDELMKATRALRDHLKDKCHCQVRDIYSKREWNMVAKLGATQWIEKIVKDGSKVVWIDTPQFRSRLINNNLDTENQSQYNTIDFRDKAISYALELAKASFESTITQYRRHFVVRIEGFDVADGNEDPLHVISPYIRYCYPEHINDLCQHLNK